ncbi:hypothetical protein BDD12DRAFT_142459 [Trichophaea hybrida]|nr:hypothetical protein BDD12DRAFT_142459 [Trichophaea hybrida]
MEQTSGSSTRDEGGGGGGGGGRVGSGNNKVEKKSDDEEEEEARTVVRKDGDGGDGNRDLLDSKPLRMRIARKVRCTRLRGHLHGRRDATTEAKAQAQLQVKVDVDVDLDLGNTRRKERTLPKPPTPASSTATIISINTNSFRNSDQLILSSTPPSSPAESGPSFSTTRSSKTRTSEVGPVTTVTSFVSAPVVTVWNSTAIRTSWHTTQTTVERTVVVIASPTIVSYRRTSTRRSSSTRHRSSVSLRPSASSSSNPSSATSSRWSSSTVFPTTYSTYGGGGGGGGGGSGVTTLPTSSPVPTNSASASLSPNVNPTLVGGVLGGLCALALVFVAILFALRRHKRRLAEQALDDAAYGGPLPTPAGPRGITERSRMVPFAAVASLLGRRSRHNRQQSAASEPTSEQGFYRIHGRKIDPVLGGPRPAGKSLEGGQSFDEGEGGHVRSPSTPISTAAGPSRLSSHTATSTSPIISSVPGPTVPMAAAIPATARIPEEKDEGEFCRESTPTGSVRRPTPTPEFITRPQLAGAAGRDGLGRSLPSHDGSRASKFTEDIV